VKTDHVLDMRTVYAVGRLYTESGNPKTLRLAGWRESARRWVFREYLP
jgi:hypothetical protein